MISPSFISPSFAGAPRFQGERATRRAQSALLTPRQLELELAEDTDPYLGTLPQKLNIPKARQADVLEQLDGLAASLLRRNFPKTFHAEGFPNVTGKKLGRGVFGVVYRLKVGDETFAFKVFKPNPKVPIIPASLVERIGHAFRHGPFAEPALGLYFTQKKTRDLANFHVANPSAGWQLYEFIDKDTNLTAREGKSLAEHGYTFQDEAKTGNRLHGIRVDYGGPLRQTPFNKLFQNGLRIVTHFFPITS